MLLFKYNSLLWIRISLYLPGGQLVSIFNFVEGWLQMFCGYVCGSILVIDFEDAIRYSLDDFEWAFIWWF